MAMSAVVACSSEGTNVDDGGSPTIEPTTAPAPAVVDVRISEIHYHAPADREDDEFVELINLGGAEIQLQGWCIDGIKYCIEESTVLAPNAFLVIGRGSFSVSLYA